MKLKLLTIIILLLFLQLAHAQDTRFSYDYRFIPDSTNISDVKNEMMYLDISKSGSKFYSSGKYESDSLMQVNLKKGFPTRGTTIKANSQRVLNIYTVSKKYPEYNTFLHTSILLDQYKVAEERPIVWKITSEKKKIGEWNTQKAETDFAGRHWLAWFTTDIPVQDGPYKFHGLPGLIVKIEDKTQSHIFTLRAVKNIIVSEDNSSDKNEIPVSSKQYSKLLKDYEADPLASAKKLMMSGDIIIDGPSIQAEKQEKFMKERIKKDNNRIELNTSL